MESCPKCGNPLSTSASCNYCNSSADYIYIKPGDIDRPKRDYGWVCPVCGAGLAPWKSKCDCNIIMPTLTTGTAGGSFNASK